MKWHDIGGVGQAFYVLVPNMGNIEDAIADIMYVAMHYGEDDYWSLSIKTEDDKWVDIGNVSTIVFDLDMAKYVCEKAVEANTSIDDWTCEFQAKFMLEIIMECYTHDDK